MQKTIFSLLILLATLPALAQSEVNQKTLIAIEETAEFPGGLSKFYEYLRKNIVYPKDARKQKVKGTVYVEFYIKEDGYVDKDSVRALPPEFIKQNFSPSFNNEEITELTESCKVEAIRVIRNSPRWIPGKLRDIPVKQKIVMPIRFGG